MAQNLRFTNNSWGVLASGINATDTAIALTAGQGARFPALTAGQFFYATLSTAANVLEIVKVTARATDALTVVRAQDNSTASAFSLADRIELRPVAALFAAMAQSDDPTLTGNITTEITASRAVVTGASSELAASATTATELGYVNGVTSGIQTQMNLKAPLASPALTGTPTANALEIGFRKVPMVASTGETAAATIVGRCYKSTGAITVPNSVFVEGDAFGIYNNSASAFALTQGSGVTLRWAGTILTGSRTLAPRGLVAVYMVSASEGVVTGAGLS